MYIFSYYLLPLPKTELLCYNKMFNHPSCVTFRGANFSLVEDTQLLLSEKKDGIYAYVSSQIGLVISAPDLCQGSIEQFGQISIVTVTVVFSSDSINTKSIIMKISTSGSVAGSASCKNSRAVSYRNAVLSQCQTECVS